MAVIALAGGGTGGHVYPAIAIGEALRDRGHTVIYYGDPARLEARVAPERGFPFRPVVTPQYPGGGLLGKLSFALGLLGAIWRTRKLLVADEVDLVLGVGGYVSAPPVLAARTMGAKRVIHEANAVPGKANRLAGLVADRVFLTFERTRGHFKGKPEHLIGVPINPRILTGDRAEALARYGLDPSRRVVLFVGGSLGAARINELAQRVAEGDRDFSVLHLTGPKYIDGVRAAYGEVPDGVVLVDYENRMQDAYAAADLVVCRSGSSTLAELCAVGKPSVLVPSPNVTDNHQEENARSLEEAGAALVLVETDWRVAPYAGRIADLMADAERLAKMTDGARALAKLDAATDAADWIEETLGGAAGAQS